MYKIGEFSKITHLTIKTLRYYDDEGILKASEYLDNGYRLYNDADFKQAEKIILLRELEFSIQEIKDVLLNTETDEDLQYYFKEKKETIDKKIEQQQILAQKLDSYLSENILEKNEASMYNIDVKEYYQETVAAIRFTGKYQSVGKYFNQIYKFLKPNISGTVPCVCYYDETYKEEADIEVCVPVKKNIADTNTIMIKQLPAIKALVTIHIGPYEQLNLAYKAILDYANEHSIKIEFPTRERYIKGPGMILKGNSKKYKTEIIMPIKE